MKEVNNNTSVTTINFQPEDLVSLSGEKITTTSLKVAEFFGKEHKNVIQKIQNIECSKEFNELNFKLVEYVDGKGEKRPCYNITKDGFVFVAMGFTGAKAAQVKEAYIRAFNQMESLLIAKPETRTKRTLTNEQMRNGLDILETASRLIRLSESSILGSLRKLQAVAGDDLPDLLPVYAIDAPISSTTGSSDPTMSLTAILKDKGLDMSTQTANKILINKGLLEKRTRPSSKGKDKQFNCLTDFGLEYSKNVVSPSNPRETAPHYYISRIDDLVDILLGAD